MSGPQYLLTKIREQMSPDMPSFRLGKISIAPDLVDTPRSDLFAPEYVPPRGVSIDLRKILRLTKNPEDGEFCIVPHDWQQIADNARYIKKLVSISQASPLIISNSGDKSPSIHLRKVVELRSFLHPWEKDTLEKIVVPYPTSARNFTLRAATSMPRISFMGYIPRPSIGTVFGNSPKAILHPIHSSVYLNRKLGVHKLLNLKRIAHVSVTSRSQFTLFNKNPNLENQSQQFQSSLDESDYVLCPRGFGNTSMRIYETLSSGATPIIIESGSPLPSYVRIPHSKIINLSLLKSWEEIITEDWRSLNEGSNYMRRQLANLQLYRTQLNFESYIRTLFSHFLL